MHNEFLPRTPNPEECDLLAEDEPQDAEFQARWERVCEAFENIPWTWGK
jgi:hypothetical protein